MISDSKSLLADEPLVQTEHAIHYKRLRDFVSVTEPKHGTWWQIGEDAPAPGNPLCDNFDPKSSDPSLYDYRTLAQYREKELVEDDMLADYALMQEFELMVREKFRRIVGNRDLYTFIRFSNRDDVNRQRALACMKLEFPMPPLRTEAAPYDLRRLEDQFRSAGISEDDIRLALKNYREIAVYGEKDPYRRDEFVEMLVQVIGEEANGPLKIQPSHGEPHHWGKTFRKKYPTRFLGTANFFSKLLVALASGSTSRVMATGKEAELEKWILNQSDRSIYPDQIFRQAYRLQQGDVYLSLLLVENVLSRYFMWNNRALLVQTAKLAPILNHIGERVDLFGSYYHIFGTILYGYASGSLRSGIAAQLERGNQFFANELSERQESFANLAGDRIGVGLKRRMKHGILKNWTSNPALLEPTHYLDHSEDFGPQIRKFWSEHRHEFVN